MKLIFAKQAWQDYLHWQATDRQLICRINALINEIAPAPWAPLWKTQLQRATAHHTVVTPG